MGAIVPLSNKKEFVNVDLYKDMHFLSRLLQTLFLSRIFYIILQNCCHYKQLMLYFVKLFFLFFFLKRST